MVLGAILVVLVPLFLILHLTGFWHAFPQMLLLGGLSYYCYVVVGQTHDHLTAVLAACLVPAAIVAFGLWRPTSGFGSWIVNGAMAAAVCLKWLALGASIVMLLMFRMDVGLFLHQDSAFPVLAIAGWMVELLLVRIVGFSTRRGARSFGKAG